MQKYVINIINYIRLQLRKQHNIVDIFDQSIYLM